MIIEGKVFYSGVVAKAFPRKFSQMCNGRRRASIGIPTCRTNDEEDFAQTTPLDPGIDQSPNLDHLFPDQRDQEGVR